MWPFVTFPHDQSSTCPPSGQLRTGAPVQLTPCAFPAQCQVGSPRAHQFQLTPCALLAQRQVSFLQAHQSNSPHASHVQRQVGFPRARQFQLVSSLSGGERRRLHLASVLVERPNVLILDEPTNDLDLQTVEVVEEVRAHSGCRALPL